MFQATSRARRGNGPSDIVDHVDRSPRKKAEQAWVLVGFITGLPAMVIASESMHPILAVVLGAVVGFVLGAVCAFFVFVWRVIRQVWWYAAEITLAVGVTAGWMNLVEHTSTPVTAAVTAVVIGVPAAVRPIRERVVALWMCLRMRHRVRKCFIDFIVTGRFDPEPFIMWATPTKAGVSVVVVLRGVSIEDVQAKLPKITTTCKAKEVTVSHTRDTNKAWVRFDVTRKNTLIEHIDSPLAGEIASTVPPVQHAITEAPTTDLDYTDVTAADVTDEHPQTEKPARRPKPAKPDKGQTNGSITGPGGEDVSDYID